MFVRIHRKVFIFIRVTILNFFHFRVDMFCHAYRFFNERGFMEFFEEAGEIPKDIWDKGALAYEVVRPGVPSAGCIHNNIVITKNEKTCAWCGQVWALKSFPNKCNKKP